MTVGFDPAEATTPQVPSVETRSRPPRLPVQRRQVHPERRGRTVLSQRVLPCEQAPRRGFPVHLVCLRIGKDSPSAHGLRATAVQHSWM